MNDVMNGVVSIALAIIGVAFLATLVSRNANTAGVIGASGHAFSTALTAAEGPVLGNVGFQGGASYGPGYYG